MSQGGTEPTQMSGRASDPEKTTAESPGIVERYGPSVLRGLLQLFPGVGAADTAIAGILNKMREDRLRALFDELASGDRPLTDDLLQSEPFLHCFFSTVAAASRTKRLEKVRLMGRLLRSAAVDSEFARSDVYEEYLQILDQLSRREIVVLHILSKHETANPAKEGESALQRINRFWSDFVEQARTALGVAPEDLEPILTRLPRTGCYTESLGALFDDPGGRGRLTSLYWALRDKVGSMDLSVLGQTERGGNG